MRYTTTSKCGPVRRLPKLTLAPGATTIADSIPKDFARSADYIVTYEDTVTGDTKTAKILANWDDTSSQETCFALLGKSPVENTTGAVSATDYELTVSNTGTNPICVDISRRI